MKTRHIDILEPYTTRGLSHKSFCQDLSMWGSTGLSFFFLPVSLCLSLAKKTRISHLVKAVHIMFSIKLVSKNLEKLINDQDKN